MRDGTDTESLSSPSRATRRRGWRGFLGRTLGSITEERLGEAMDVSRALVRQMLGRDEKDPTVGAAMHLDALPGLRSLGPDGIAAYDLIVDELAKISGRVVVADHDPADDTGNDLANLEALQRTGSAVIGQLLVALTDRRIDRSEATPIRPLIRKAIQVLHRWDQILARVEREGVVGVRGLS